jgi:hypothetical protein
VSLVLGITKHTGIRLAEVGFLLILIAGVWLAVAESFPNKWRRLRIIVSGVLLASAGALLIVATHWGHFG